MAIQRQSAECVIQFKGDDQVTQKVKLVNDSLGLTKQKTEEATGAAKTWKEQIDGVRERVETLSKGFGSIVSEINPTIGAALKLGKTLSGVFSDVLQQQVEYTRKLALSATMTQELGQGATDALRAAAGNQVFGDAERMLQRSALAAHEAGLARQQIEEAVQLSTQLANARGLAPEEVSQTVLQALTTGRDRALKTYGIVVDKQKAEADYARSLGVGIGLLDEQAKKTAVIRAEFEALRKAALEGDSDAAKAAAKAGEQFANWNRLMAFGKKAGGAIGMSILDYDLGSGITKSSPMLGALGESALQKAISDSMPPGMFDALGKQIDAIGERNRLLEAGRRSLEDEVLGQKQARDSQIAHNLALAGAAANLGAADQAARYYAQAQKLMADATGQTTGSIQDQVRALQANKDAAIRNAYALAVNASAMGLPIAPELWAKANAEMGIKAPAAARGGGGSGQRMARTLGEGWEGMAAMGADARKDLARTDMERALQASDIQVRALKADIEQIRAEREGVEAAQKAIRDATRDNGRDAVRSAAQTSTGIARALAGGVDLVANEVDRFSGLMDMFGKAGSLQPTTDALKASAPGALSALGAFTAGFIDNQQAQAAIMAAMETAASIASFAILDYRGGALHAAAAVAYGVAAATTPTGGGGGGGRTPRTGQAMPPGYGPTQRPQSQAVTVNVHVNGAQVLDKNFAHEVVKVGMAQAQKYGGIPSHGGY